MPPIYGHKKQREFLAKKLGPGAGAPNQLAHAYLFTGARDIGKKKFALEFAELVGCKFPDLMIVQEANKKDEIFADGGEIKISQVREVQNFLSYKSYNGGFKIVIIDEAEKMSQEGQNCFLKTLEEPKGQTLLILISSRPDMILPTISSRCQTLKFFRNKEITANPEKLKKNQEILKDLLPLIGAGFAEKFKYAKAFDFEKQSLMDVLEILQRHFRQQLLNNFADKKAKNFLELSEEINNKMLFTNANPKLALEILLMEI